MVRPFFVVNLYRLVAPTKALPLIDNVLVFIGVNLTDNNRISGLFSLIRGVSRNMQNLKCRLHLAPNGGKAPISFVGSQRKIILWVMRAYSGVSTAKHLS